MLAQPKPVVRRVAKQMEPIHEPAENPSDLSAHARIEDRLRSNNTIAIVPRWQSAKSDPRNPEHPAHREKWLEIFGAFGRVIADRDWYQDNPEYQRPTDYPFRNAFERLKQPPSGNAQ